MAKRNKAHYFHAHRSLFVDLVRPDTTRQVARALWHQMFKAKEGVAAFPREARTAYNTATRLLTQQMRATENETKEAA